MESSKPEKRQSLPEALYNHLVLPPKLPHRQDHNISEVEDEVIKHLFDSAQHIRDLPRNQFTATWSAICRGLQATRSINSNGHVDRSALARELRLLGDTDFLVVHVRCQNCALYVRRGNDPILGPAVIFESFEASARNEDILATENALQWDFPGNAAAVSLSTFFEDGFIYNLSTFLEHASRETVKNFSAHAFKAGTTVYEYRNTPEPSLVSSFLMAILQENGRRIAPTLLRKMVRDDVCWRNTDQPWRRLPYWLVLRVSVARYLAQNLGGEAGRIDYKFLIADVLAQLAGKIHVACPSVERLDLLRKKLCRRLVKLESDKHQLQNHKIASRVDYLFDQLDPRLKAAIRGAAGYIDASWSHQELSMTKSVPPLPLRAAPEDLHMNLRVSGGYLRSIWRGFSRPRWRELEQDSVSLAVAAKKNFNSFSRSHFHVIDLERECCEFCIEAQTLSARETCKEASGLILQYLGTAMHLYVDLPEQKSLMILYIMELWVAMDKAACALFPLIREYHPVFHPQMLDVLLIPTFSGIERVRSVQMYLRDRIAGSGHSKHNIFDDPGLGCVGYRWYEESSDSLMLKNLHESIERHAAQMRKAKEEEWRQKSENYARLSKSYDQSSCVFQVDDMNPLGRGIHDPRQCPRCKILRQLSNIRIEAYEHPLPHDSVIAKTVIFELACPSAFAVYRQTTWQIIFRLAYSQQEEGIKPRCLLREYQQLQRFSNNVSSNFSLASTTKPFLTTHYSTMYFPVEWESGRDGVCRPNGLKLAYFDERSHSWPGRIHCRPTFSHHFKLEMPKSSPFSLLMQDPTFSDKIYGPSSYEIAATALKCPQGINVHEYLAFQTIASGMSRRWLAILTELGSANLNFSNEATALLLGHLIIQCGPLGDDGDAFRLIHSVFHDPSFCMKLIEQLCQRLDGLLANWREIYLMESIIAITLRLVELSSAGNQSSVLREALRLLHKARHTCARWFKMLRAEARKVTDADNAQRCQQYAIWAALLCKRTFQTLVSGIGMWNALSMELFIQSSITVQDNMVVKLESLPRSLQRAIIKDLRMSYDLRHDVSNFIVSNPSIFESSLRDLWPEEEGWSREFSDLKLRHDGWLSCVSSKKSPDEETKDQAVYYNYIEGILTVDGYTVGKLPKDPKKAFILDELFPNQALLTYPSDRPGMQYVLCVRPRGFQVHVGYGDGGQVIVRAFRRPYSLQLIPRETFRRGNEWDLPGPVLDGNFHWLNLRDGTVYITNRQAPWPKNIFTGFVLNVEQHHCMRARKLQGKIVYDDVVNPYSPLFTRATRILESFEARRNILVVQPWGARNLQVELPRLQTLFFVNEKNLLQSPQLQCEIDPNQDAGTWYGLRSKLVCRHIRNPMHRSILVPFGELLVEPHGCHVQVNFVPNGTFGRFIINSTLGRIDCAAEPTLVYMKALIHAYTSFVLPDPLTGRTGTEEAIHWLRSGLCQPWAPLGPNHFEKLEAIAKLTPKREYYPQDLRVMRTDSWSESLPIVLQSSLFRPIVDDILQTSENLRVFAPNDNPKPELPSVGDLHLHTRAIVRQNVFERCLNGKGERNLPNNKSYQPRDRVSANNIRHSNVLEVTNLVRRSPRDIETTSQLSQLLADGSTVGGFGSPFDKPSLNDRINSDIVQCWGSLVTFAQQTHDLYSLMYLFGLIAFRLDTNMSLVRTLVAFSTFDELRTMQPPPWDEYSHFRPDQAPQLDYLLRLLKPFESQRLEDGTEILEEFSSAKQRKRLQIERSRHALKVEEDSRFFANFLLNQWPRLEPSVEGLSRPILLDVNSAIEAIRPEWRRLYQNFTLTKHLKSVQEVLNHHTTAVKYEPPQCVVSEETFTVGICGYEVIDLGDLLCKPMLAMSEMKLGENALQTATRGGAPTMSQRNSNQGGWSLPGATISKLPPMLPNPLFRRTLVTTPGFSSSAETASSILVLEGIVGRLSAARSTVKRKYASDLQQSLNAFRKAKPSIPVSFEPPRTRELEVNTLQTMIDEIFQRLEVSLSEPSPGCSGRSIRWLKAGNLWPVVTKRTLLEHLCSMKQITQKLGSGIYEAMIQLGVEITKFQREVRLHDLALKKEPGRYHEEQSNPGHSNWNPAEYPDWLLLEIESNMMIRPVQVDVALATISPKSGSNSVLQMNMGQGKTSCIIPMVAAALADTKRLVRVLVPKALLQQTAQLLHIRLGGLQERQLRHVPFSRRTPTTEKSIRLYHGIHRDMLQSGGIMICQPEHNMSFMLSGHQRLLDNQIAQAGPMINVQSWISKMSRDILDESDYTLAVRTQLIYPSGSQITVDGHPHRWQVAEAILRLVNNHAFDLSQAFPHSIDVTRRPGGGFPLIFFLRHDVEDELVRRVTLDICQGRGGILPMSTNAIQRDDRVAIKDFITSPRPRLPSIEKIRKLCPDRPSLRQTVYLLRGLLVNRILMMTLKKRWNVEYGLHPKRDPIAVPFHAKGVPSEQSEWGHPDVAILFTCLAFYYDGINHDQLRQCLEHILKSDDPSTEYDKWTQSTENFPPSMRAWNSINVDDEMQLSEMWKVVRYQGVVVDYFLNNFVFPRHAKQFKVKLQSNGWDIPLFSTSERHVNTRSGAKPLTTGFSGTNDNRTMLPLNIKQDDLPPLHHTNAEVLTYLLHPRNRKCVLPRELILRDVQGEVTSEMKLLHGLRQRQIRVLIDAGAQILEMDNITLATAWLEVDPSALAALYFDEANKPWVVTRQGRHTPLLASPFADDLSQCLVYLDEAHTRGTDLRLPPDACGALTLRLGQTKDHTVQAAMRLRQLGTTQSIKFFIPPEVHQSIADLQRKTVHGPIDSADVIEWLLNNTCEGIEQLQPLYYSQGIDFCRRMQASLGNPDFLTDRAQRERFINTIKQDEQQTLQQLYEPKSKAKNRSMEMQTSANAEISGFVRELNSRRKAFQDTGRAVHGSALQEVEQEREVAFEVESVRQVKKPHQYPAHSFPGLHPSLESFARTGRLPADAHCFIPMLHSLSKTAVGRKFRVSRTSSESKLLVSAQFDRTVKLSIDLSIDNFIRPVNWVLWSPITETAVIIIPEEAEALLPIMRDRAISVQSHLLIYSAPITRKMKHFNHLDYYSIPPLATGWVAPSWLRVELGLYAGRLYFDWFEYKPLCDLLGIQEGVALEDETELPFTLDGAVDDERDENNTDAASLNTTGRKLVEKPLTFIQEWLAVRRRGQDFEHSPMGFVSQGRSLQQNHAFFNEVEITMQQQNEAIFAPVTCDVDEDAEDNDDDDFVDDMGANQATSNGAKGVKIVYDASETRHVERAGHGQSNDSSSEDWESNSS